MTVSFDHIPSLEDNQCSISIQIYWVHYSTTQWTRLECFCREGFFGNPRRPLDTPFGRRI